MQLTRALPLPLCLMFIASAAQAQDAKPAAPAAPAKPEVIHTADWTITTGSLEGVAVHKRTKEKIVLYQQMDEGERKECTDYAFSGRVVSVVGTFVSVEIQESGYCGGAHPFEWHGFSTKDLARGGHRVHLTEIFDKYELEDALKKDTWLIKARANPDEFACVYSEESLTTEHFAFHHMKDNKVAVRLGLPHGCEVARGSFTQLGVYLTPTEWLTKRLEAAEKAKLLLGQRSK